MSVRNAVRYGLRAMTSNATSRSTLLAMTRAGLLPPQVWKRLPVTRTFPVRLPDGQSFLYSAVSEDSIGRALHWRGLGGFEPETVRVFYELARHARTVLDIGANSGIFTLLACGASSDSTVVAFEPVPHIYLRLVANIKGNDWTKQCRTMQVAVSNGIGTAKFHVPFGEMPTSASLNTAGFRGWRGALIDVPVTTVDAACAGAGKVDLVKIDVEGFEDRVLEGMQRVLAESQPDLIVECNPDGPYPSVDRILSSFGYRFYHLLPEGPVHRDRIIPDTTETYRNFLCSVRPHPSGYK